MSLFKSLGAAVAVTIALGGAASAETILKLATAAPEATPWGDQVKRFAEWVAEESEGRLKVEPYYSSQLGTETDTLTQLARGRIEMGLFTINAAAVQAPEIGLVQLYGYFEDNAQRACVQENHLTDFVRERLSGKGVYFGAWAEVGNGYIASNQPFSDIEGIKGLKVGTTMTKGNAAHWQRLGANPLPMSQAEATSAASTGLIDIYPTPYSFYIPAGLNKVLPYMVEYNVSNGPAMWALSQRVMDGLSEEDQAAMKRAFAKINLTDLMTEIFGFEDKMREFHKSQGGQIVTLTPEAVAGFRDRLPAYWQGEFEAYGEDGAMISALLEKAKAACVQ